uniref:Uncharacterized protein n=1 Tax=Heterorhabditis bacteriophora TaxID=37862 RepID=A0A1I7XUS9_HETBA
MPSRIVSQLRRQWTRRFIRQVRSHLLHRSLAIPKDASTVSHLVPQSIPAFALFPLCSCERMVAGRR